MTTNDTVTIVKNLPAGTDTDYSADNIHAEVRNGSTYVIQASNITITNSTTDDAGSITIEDIPITVGINRITMYNSEETNLDDTTDDTHTSVVKLGYATVKKVALDNDSVLEVK